MLPSHYEFIETRFRYLLFFLDAVGELLFFPRRCKTKGIDLSGVRSIMVLCAQGLGDAVLSSGCLRALRRRFPEARLDALAGPRSLEIVKTFPFLDHVYHLDNPLYRLREGKRPGFSQARGLLQELRHIGYDLSVDFLGDLPSCWAAFCIRAKWRIAHPTMGGGFFLTHKVRRDPRNRTQRAALAEPLGLLGVGARAYPLEVFFTDHDLKKMKEVLAQAGYDGRPMAVLAPGALHGAKRWPAERFGRLIDLLVSQRGMFACLVGAVDDDPPARAVEEACQERRRLLNLSGRLSLTETTAVISLASLFVGNDSGLTHVAAAAGVPVVQLFGPGIPERFGHHGERDLMFFDPDCPYNPCSPFACRRPQRWCMERISPQDVFEGINRGILSRGPGVPARQFIPERPEA